MEMELNLAISETSEIRCMCMGAFSNSVEPAPKSSMSSIVVGSKNGFVCALFARARSRFTGLLPTDAIPTSAVLLSASAPFCSAGSIFFVRPCSSAARVNTHSAHNIFELFHIHVLVFIAFLHLLFDF